MNIGDLFDSPWKVLIIAALLIVFFGARKLPAAAHSLGKSMRILKREVSGLHEDDDEPATSPTAQGAPAQAAPAQLQAPASPVAAPDAQAQIDALSKQLADLQQSVKTTSDSAQAN
jgi:sec-independent protein translocase protein TatA